MRSLHSIAGRWWRSASSSVPRRVVTSSIPLRVIMAVAHRRRRATVTVVEVGGRRTRSRRRRTIKALRRGKRRNVVVLRRRRRASSEGGCTRRETRGRFAGAKANTLLLVRLGYWRTRVGTRVRVSRRRRSATTNRALPERKEASLRLSRLGVPCHLTWRKSERIDSRESERCIEGGPLR